jgi:hypothetical protein
MVKDPELKSAYRIAGFASADKADVVHLQSADALAFECWKHVENRIVEGPLRNLRKSFADLFRQGIDQAQHWARGGLRRLVEAGRHEGLDDLATVIRAIKARQLKRLRGSAS